MSKLDMSNWKNFKYKEIFEIKKGKRLTKEDFIEGNTPFIGAIDNNNGYRDFIGQEPIHKGNTITVNYNGSVGEAFYQPIDFWASDDVNVLYPKFRFNQYIAMFILPLIKKEKFRFNYGRKWESDRMKESIILLPSKNNAVDVDFMENHIKSLTESFMIEDEFLNSKSQSISSNKIELNILDWQYFNFQDIFTIKKGKRLTKEDQISGQFSYISSSSNNNGVDNKISNGFTDENCLSFACYGSIGEVFYHKDKVWISDNCNAIYLKNKKLNKYVAFFLITLMKLEKYRFSYGMTAKKERLETFKIKLPIDKFKNPDFEYMENYIKSLPYSSDL